MLIARPGEPFIIDLQLFDKAPNKYPSAKIRNSHGILIQTINLSHVDDGLYTATAVLPIQGYYTVQITTYKNSSRTVEDLLYEIVEYPIYNMVDISDLTVATINQITNTINSHTDEALEDAIGEIGGITKNISINLTTGVLFGSKTQEIIVWCEINGVLLTNPTSCSVKLKNGADSVVHDFGVNNTHTSGFFRYTKPSANTILKRGETYIAEIAITHGGDVYTGYRSLTVLS